MATPPPPPPLNKPPPPSQGPPPPPGKPGASATKKKWAPVVAEKPSGIWSPDPSWSFPRDITSVDINSKINWDEAIGASEAEQGGDGVFFVQLGSRALVIKASVTIGADMFASKLANRVGISTPDTKLLVYLHSGEWDPFAQKMWQLEATNSDGRGSKFAKCLFRPFLMLSEYIPGYHLANIPTDKVPAVLSDHILREIGRLIALDLFLNQWDRFPCGKVWSNDGNPKNVMFRANGGGGYILKAIDNNITSIDPTTHQDNFNLYRERVQATLRELHTNKGNECDAINSIRDFIKSHTGHDIGEGPEIQQGICEEVKKIADFPLSEIVALQSEVDKEVRETMSLLGLDDIGLSRINLSYLENMHKLFVELSQN